MVRQITVVSALLVWAVALMANDSRIRVYPNEAGQMGTFSTNGEIDRDNPFFQDLGTNGRTCNSCHQPDSAWSITPRNVDARFRASRGTDPIFSNNDGSNCEGALPATLAQKRTAYSLLLTRGLIRVGLDVPAGAEFILDSVRDPYQCGAATNDVSLYRRPLPSANLRFLTAVMWDGRESSPVTTIAQDLLHQANDATRGHAAAGRDVTPTEAQQIVDFEMGLFAAQTRDRMAGDLGARGATGGPAALPAQPFFTGINDPVGLNPTGAPFDPNVFTIFTPWLSLRARPDEPNEARRAIARGEQIFNTKPLVLSGVSGLNNQTFPNGVTVPDPVVGSCTLCHDSPNAGNHSVKAPLNIGLTAPDVAPYLPVYTLRRISTGETIETTDPGRAMISGKWADIGRFKGPILRGLSARAPYFHNGSAATLDEVIEFYVKRFNLVFTPQEKADLIAFLRTL